ncbi:MAG: hypothetical protein P8J33_15020 [Pirellulaceae bacterium]|nr:hypothetical protein [Pirellulaceae bacterium]
MIDKRVEGRVVALNDQGDLITDVPAAECAAAPNQEEVRVQVGGHETIGIYPPDHNEPAGTLIAIINAEGCLNIGITGINISEMLGIGVGETVTVIW